MFVMCDVQFTGTGFILLGNKIEMRLENLLRSSLSLISNTQVHSINEIVIVCSSSSYNNNNNNRYLQRYIIKCSANMVQNKFLD